MYPHMIEVHYLESGEPHMFNIDNIETFYPGFENKDTSVINMVSRELYVIDESYDELKQLIRDAGCHIVKKDPRMDDKPLEWDDFAGQEGDIFWNSNLREWWLFDRMIELNNGTAWLAFRDFNGITQEVYPDDLKAKPMYRMKVTK